jgi:hypothetical protein
MRTEGESRNDAGDGVALRWGTLIGLALLVRVGIAAVSIGSNDARLFFTFAAEIRRFGIVQMYGLEGLFNHPPLVGAWIEAAGWLASRAPHPLGAFHAFTFIFKLPVMAGEMLSVFLIWKIWSGKRGMARLLPSRSTPDESGSAGASPSRLCANDLARERAWAIGAAAACSFCGIVVSAYHCNTDPLYAALCLAAVYFMEERGAFLLAGLALGAAINVKIVPVLLIPGLLLSCQSYREARLFVMGLAAGVIPFLPVLASEAPGFAFNALQYNSSINNWGLTLFLLAGKLLHGDIGANSRSVETYHDLGRYLLFAMIGAWAVAARMFNRWSRYEIAAVTFAIFLVFTPGFGIQYVVMIAPLLFAIRPRMALIYSTAAGAFAAALYLTHRVLGMFPFQSNLGRFPLAESMLGLIAWAVLVRFLIVTVGGDAPEQAGESATGQPPVGSYTSARAA